MKLVKKSTDSRKPAFHTKVLNTTEPTVGLVATAGARQAHEDRIIRGWFAKKKNGSRVNKRK